MVSLADRPVSLGLTKACVRRLDLFVTTDSGPRHFAAAFGIPVVSLFGPTFIEWTETYYPRGINLQKQVPCGPCASLAEQAPNVRGGGAVSDTAAARVAAALQTDKHSAPRPSRAQHRHGQTRYGAAARVGYVAGQVAGELRRVGLRSGGEAFPERVVATPGLGAVDDARVGGPSAVLGDRSEVTA